MDFLLQGKAWFTPTLLQKHLDLCLIVNTTLDFTFPHSCFLLGVMFTFPASRSFWKHPVLLWSLYLSISGAKVKISNLPHVCLLLAFSPSPVRNLRKSVMMKSQGSILPFCRIPALLAPPFHNCIKPILNLQLFLEKTHTYIHIYRCNHKHCLIK